VPKNVKFDSDKKMADQANGKEEVKRSAKLPPAASAKPPKATAPQNSAPNQGRVPKYIEKFKEEAKQKRESSRGP
jgi:hypothetical protein